MTHQYALTPLGLLWRLGWLAPVVLDLAAAAGLLALTSFDPGVGVRIVGAGLTVAAFRPALLTTEYGVRGPGRLLHLPHGIKKLPATAVAIEERYDIPRLGPPPT